VTKTSDDKKHTGKQLGPKQGLLRYTFVALIGSLVALATAGFIFQKMVLSASEQKNQRLLSDTYTAHYQAFINNLTAEIQTRANGLATLDLIKEAINTQNKEALIAAQKKLKTALPEALAVNIYPKGSPVLDRLASPPSGYTAKELVRKTQSGEGALPEAHPFDKNWVLRVTAPVTNIDELNRTNISGVLMVTWPLSKLTASLSSFNTTAGQIKLIQQVSNKNVDIFKYGTAGNQSETSTVELNKSNWTLTFSPANTLGQQSIDTDNLMIMVFALATAIIVISVFFTHALISSRIRQNANTLVLYCQELFAGRIKTPHIFTMNIFQSLSTTIAHLSKESIHALQTAPIREKSNGDLENQKETVQMPDTGLNQTMSVDILEDEDPLDISDAEEEAENIATNVAIPDEIFRAYDIRGIVNNTLTVDGVRLIGQAIGSEAFDQGQQTVIIAADGRHSSPELSQALTEGLTASGRDVITVGTVPTPLLYFATNTLDSQTGVMITGSHNPPEYNGLKIVIAGNTLSGEQISALKQRIDRGNLLSGNGEVQQVEIIEEYVEHVSSDIAIAEPLKIVVDCGNGVAGAIAPQLLEACGCEVVPLYCEVDGDFPNHHPDPSKPENLADLITKVKETQADVGFAFDGDGDRLGVVTNSGRIIFADHLLQVFAKDIVSRNPGADVIFDVKCSRRLNSVIAENGGRPVMWKTGHSLIKNKMKETGALLAGEMSGHIFFKERWFGFDDGLYSAARLLEILSLEAKSADELFDEYPTDVCTPEINIPVSEDNKFGLVETLCKQGTFNGGTATTIDGIRVDFADGWGLVRASNTTPVIVLRFEADTEDALSRIKNLFKEQLAAVDDTLDLSF